MKNDEIEIIYRENYTIIYQYLFALSKNSSVAQDLAQETFIKALIHISECDFAMIKAWLFKVAHNMYLDFLKKEKHINYNQPLEDIVRKSDVENKNQGAWTYKA